MIHYLKLPLQIVGYKFSNASESIGQEWSHNTFCFFWVHALNNFENRFVLL